MELKFSKTITKSGAPLWVLSSTKYNSVTIGVAVKCGTRDEIWPKEAGIAHALEHMHFQGTENFPNNLTITGHIEEVGGHINATTGSERTFFYSIVPVGYAERVVHILSEQLNKAIIPENKIPIEMKNIIQEINKRDDNPRAYLSYLSNNFIYNGHSLSKDGLGLKESVLAFTREDFLSFKKRYYNSANYVFVAVGNITEQEALNLFNKYFQDKASVNENIRINEDVKIQQEKQLIKRKDLNQLHVSLSALIGAGKDLSSTYLEFFNKMIAGGMSFPLFQEVRDKRGLCYSINSSLSERSDIGRINIYIGTDPKRYKEAIDATLEVIQKSKTDEALLNKVKNLKLGQLLLNYESTWYIAASAVSEIFLFGAPRGFEEIKKEIESVSIDDIEKAVNKYLRPELIYTTLLAPNDFEV